MALASFEDFFSSVHEYPPLGWQARLARQVAEKGEWPSLIGVPTGLGKTACIDIAVWSLAHDAATGRRVLPTRTWYLVNRRLLVDAAYQRAERLVATLRDRSAPGPVRSVAEALRSIRPSLLVGDDSPPLELSRLRGGADLDGRPRDPAQPALLFATVPMFASRWLFAGYGSSRGALPIDAALAGTDSLVLLDEAHLSRALLAMSEPLMECDPIGATVPLPPARRATKFVSLTATGDVRHDRFDLDASDLREQIVASRLGAAKPTKIIDQVGKGDGAVAGALHAAAVALLQDQPGRSCLVFANTPAIARKVHDLLAQGGGETGRSVELLTGRLRPGDATSIIERLLDEVGGIPAGGRPSADRVPLYVVATQTLEVGADVSADYLVTQVAGRRALIQRFGRLNRLGSQPWAEGRIVMSPTTIPLYGEEPSQLAQALSPEVALDLSPGNIAAALGSQQEPEVQAPELLPALVWEWAKTSSRTRDAADPAAYFDPQDMADRSVSVCWRAFLPPPGYRVDPLVSSRETVDIPIWEFSETFEGGQVHRLTPDHGTLELTPVEMLRPGDTVVLPCDAGRYDAYGWNPSSVAPVTDTSHERALLLPIVDGASLHLSGDEGKVAEMLGELRRIVEARWQDDWDPAEPIPDMELSRVIANAIDELADLDGDEAEGWRRRLRAVRLAPAVVPWPTVPPGPPSGEIPLYGLVLGRPEGSARYGQPPLLEVLDELSLGAWLEDPTSCVLSEHMASVGRIAQAIGEAIGLPSGVLSTVSAAGRVHDAGKQDPRFQRWLADGEAGDVPLAKSNYGRHRQEPARTAAGWPRGGRHETLSARAVEAWARLPDADPTAIDIDLLLHLVISHHGHGRPSMPLASQIPSPPATIDVFGTPVTIDTDLSAPELDQPARFRRLCQRYGYWGLALLETIVRQADHLASGVCGVDVPIVKVNPGEVPVGVL